MIDLDQSIIEMNEWFNQSIIEKLINNWNQSINYWKGYFAISILVIFIKTSSWQIPACILEICQNKEKKRLKFENRQISRFQAYFAILHLKDPFVVVKHTLRFSTEKVSFAYFLAFCTKLVVLWQIPSS